MTSSPVQKPRRSLTIATVVLAISVIVTVAFWVRNAQTVAQPSAERFLFQTGYWQHLTLIEKDAISNATKDDDLSQWKGWVMILTTHGLDAKEEGYRTKENYWTNMSERIVKLPLRGIDVELADYANRRAHFYRTQALHYKHKSEGLKWVRNNWAGLHFVGKLFDPDFKKRVEEFENGPVKRERDEEAALERQKLEMDVLRTSVRGILSSRYSSEFQ